MNRNLWSIGVSIVLVSCGQDPSFLEREASTAASAQGGGDVTNGSTDVDSETATQGNENPVAENNPVDTSSPGNKPYTPPPEYPPATPIHNVLSEDGGTMSIPGVKATKVGINFEDLTDFDFNDSVLCFSGNLKINGTKVVSYMKQTIQASVWNRSACGHYIDVQIKDSSGVVTQSFRYNDRNTTAATLEFDVGSELSVTMVSFPNTGCVASVAQSNLSRAKVVPNICNR